MTSEDSAAPAPKRPVPTPSPESAPFWRAAKERRLLLPHCKACGRFWFPPSLRCPHCLSDDADWTEASGEGRVHSFVAVHRVYHPAFAHATPYLVAVVELAEGPRLLTNLVDIAPEQARCGMPVSVTFEDISKDIALPKFKPASPRAGAS